MKKVIFLVVVLLVASTMIFAGGGGDKGAGGTGPILIGHSASLTGPSALWGQSERMALQMEADRINAAGGVLGRKIEFRHYDNQTLPAEAVNVANRLVSDRVVAVIGPSQSGTSRASSYVYVENKIPMLATTATNELVTVPEGATKPLEFVFRMCFIDPYQGAVAAAFAYRNLGVKKAGILQDVGSDYSTFLARNFQDRFRALGGEIVALESFRSGELEFRAQLAKIREAGAELLFIPTQQTEAGLAMRQAGELGLNMYYLGGDGWGSVELMELGGPATEGSFFVNLASLEDPVLAQWVKDYNARFGQNPAMPNPVMAVDALRAIVAAINATGGTDGTALARWLSNCKDVPVLSGLLTIDPNTHNPIGKAAVIETVKNGEFVFYMGIPSAL